MLVPQLSAVILKDAHYMLYYLTPAIQPRMLVTFNEDLSPLSVNVRVGQVREREGERERERERERENIYLTHTFGYSVQLVYMNVNKSVFTVFESSHRHNHSHICSCVDYISTDSGKHQFSWAHNSLMWLHASLTLCVHVCHSLKQTHRHTHTHRDVHSTCLNWHLQTLRCVYSLASPKNRSAILWS